MQNSKNIFVWNEALENSIRSTVRCIQLLYDKFPVLLGVETLNISPLRSTLPTQQTAYKNFLSAFARQIPPSF